MDIVNTGCTLVRVVRNAVDDYHLSGIALICRLHCGTAYHKGFVYINAGCQVGCASLQG